MTAVLTALAIAFLIAALLAAYGRRHRPIVVLGSDVPVPRAVGIPTAHRRARKDVWR